MESYKAADDCQNKEKMSHFHKPFIVLQKPKNITIRTQSNMFPKSLIY